MKKSLVLLPLIAGFALAGCTFTIGNKTFKLFEKNNSESQQEKGSGNNSSGGNGGSQSGGDEGGSYLEKVSMLKKDKTSFDGTTIVFSKNGYSVTITKGEATQTVQAAYDAVTDDSKAFRIYQKFVVTLEAPVEFSGFKTKGYVAHYDNGDKDYNLTQCEGATVDYDGSANSTATLDAKASSFTFVAGAQLRLDYFAFF